MISAFDSMSLAPSNPRRPQVGESLRKMKLSMPMHFANPMTLPLPLWSVRVTSFNWPGRISMSSAPFLRRRGLRGQPKPDHLYALLGDLFGGF